VKELIVRRRRLTITMAIGKISAEEKFALEEV